MKRGYIKLWRMEFDTVSYSKSLKHVGLMQLLRHMANYRAKMFRGEWIYPGQFAASIATLSNESGESIKTIRNLLSDLENDGLILTANRANRYTIITICNYATLQGLICLDGLTEELTKGATKGATKDSTKDTAEESTEGTLLEREKDLTLPPIVPPEGNGVGRNEGKKDRSGIVGKWLKRGIGRQYKRRAGTAWSEKEVRKLAEIAKRPEALREWQAIRRLYRSGYEYYRRDIITLLNNWTGELDRANRTITPGKAEEAVRSKTGKQLAALW